MRAVYVAAKASVPIVTIVIRKCYGMAGMAATDKNGLDFKIAWPSAEWGSLPVEGGAAAAFRREIEAAPDPKQRLAEIEADLRKLASPFLTAEAFAVEDVIDPRETRAYLCRFIDAMQGRLATSVGVKRRAGFPVEPPMIKWAIIFFLISVVAGFFGFTGVASGARTIAKWLFGIALVIFIIVLVFGVMLGKLVF
jgi:uncharacterized membrane protein YtjA (UPF0391 family)